METDPTLPEFSLAMC